MYVDQRGEFKGDALVVYFKPQSVQLACEMLDETKIRPEQRDVIRVQPAQFEKSKVPTTKKTKNNKLVQLKR
jgi:HIV Tat-specific factor 1